MKRRKKSSLLPIIIGIFLIICVFMGVGYSLLNENLTINGTVKIQKQEAGLPSGQDFEVTFHNQGATGSSTYNYAMTIKNITNTASTLWKVYILVPSDTTIKSVWGGSAEIVDGVLIITSASWNGSIAAGGSAGYAAGFTVETNDSSILPLKYTALKG